MDSRLFTQTIQTEKKPGQSLPQQVELLGYPPLFKACFELLQLAGVNYFALFGGAVRDADYAVRHGGISCAIKDYDFRIWLPNTEYEKQLNNIIQRIELITGTTIKEVASLGTERLRHSFIHHGIEWDISFRPIPQSMQTPIPIEAVAIDRASDSDIGLCSVAIDPNGKVWARPEYLFDQKYKTLTVFSSQDIERIKAYTKRMQEKFPNHKLIWQENSHPLLDDKTIQSNINILRP